MRKLLIASMLFLALVFAGFAEPSALTNALQQEVLSALNSLSAEQIGSLTIGELEKLAVSLSMTRQKAAYVQRSRMASLFMPGLGQFKNGDPAGGTLYMLANLAIMGGTMAGAYFLLPADLQFDRLDYLASTPSAIKAAWESHGIGEFLPAAGVMAGGMLLKGILGCFSAADAADLAWKNIADGKVVFVPDFRFLGRGFGMGMMMRF